LPNLFSSKIHDLMATPVATRTLDLAGREFAGQPGLISQPTARILARLAKIIEALSLEEQG
jgi:hypothetical protein